MSNEQKVSLSPKEKKKIESIISSLIDSEIQVAVAQSENARLKKLVMETFNAFDLSSYDLISQQENSMSYTVTKVTLVRGNTVTYDVKKFKKALGKKRANLFLKKRFTLTNVQEFKKLLDEYGVPGKEVKKYVLRDESVNETSINQAYEVGELSVKELEGTYTVKPRTEFLRITSQKKEIASE